MGLHLYQLLCLSSGEEFDIWQCVVDLGDLSKKDNEDRYKSNSVADVVIRVWIVHRGLRLSSMLLPNPFIFIEGEAWVVLKL